MIGKMAAKLMGLGEVVEQRSISLPMSVELDVALRDGKSGKHVSLCFATGGDDRVYKFNQTQLDEVIGALERLRGGGG